MTSSSTLSLFVQRFFGILFEFTVHYDPYGALWYLQYAMSGMT